MSQQRRLLASTCEKSAYEMFYKEVNTISSCTLNLYVSGTVYKQKLCLYENFAEQH